jgi:hypothetical protein
MFLRKWQSEVVRVFSRDRIAKNLVAVICLSFIQTLGVPVIGPGLSKSSASTFDSSGLILNWDASNASSYTGQGATTFNDLSGNSTNGTLTVVGSASLPTFTNTRPTYLKLGTDSTYTNNYYYIRSGDLKSKLDATSSETMQNISIFTWVYPTANGIIIDETNAVNGWQDSQIEMADGKFSFRVWNSEELISNVTTPMLNWYYVGLVYSFSAKTLTGYVNGNQVGQLTGLDRFAPWENVASDGIYYSVGRYDPTNLGSGSGGNFRFGSLHIFKTAINGTTVLNNFQAGLTRFGPVIGNPSSVSTFINKSATFSVSACTGTTSGTGTTACTYQWQLSTDGGTNYSNISSATSLSYTTPALSASANGNRYRVIAYDPGTGSPTSERLFSVSTGATLSVSTPLGSDTDTALTLSAGKYAWASDSNEFDVTSAITMQAWVYQTATNAGTWNMVMNKENSYELGTIGSLWYFGLQGSGGWAGVNTGIATRLNEWQHVALTRATGANTAKFYVNGQEVWSGTADGASTGNLTNSTQPFTIGGRSSDGVNFSSPFLGNIDEVRVYRSARTQAEIAADMHSYGPINTSNLALYYDFNEGSGSTLINRVSGSSSSSDLTIVGSPSWSENITRSTFEAYTIRTFTRSYLTSSGGWKVPAGVTQVSTLVVAGGGGGGSDEGGGGGGGGFLESTLTSLNSSHLTVQVGQGGLGAYGGDELTKGANGQNSVFSSLTAIGGGGGGSSVNTTSTLRNGSSGGSGGGGAGENFTNRLGGSGTPGQGFDGGAGGAASSTARGGGGGGAGQAGIVGGAGGAGKASTITGTSVFYAGGGGGGHGNSTSGSGAAGGTGGGGTGGDYNSANTRGSANTGGGGGGGCGNVACGDWNAAYSGASGGSGVIVIRWITASAPIFTAPGAVDTTTAGTRYTFRVSGSATSPLIRNYQWQFSSNSGSTWTTQQSSTSDSFTTSTLETTTSGITNLYRVIVTDSDTAGLSISDSRTSYLVINPRITITVDTSTITRDYGVATVKTFTFANGTGPRVATASPGNQSGITWSNLNSDSATLTLAPTLTAGSYSDTITVTDSVTATTSLRLTITINKARQASLSIGQYNAFVGTSTYPINVYGGSGTGAVTRSRLSAGSANCTLTSEMFLTATSPGTCSVQAVKAGDTNYLSETATATIYWIQWSDAYATRAPSTPTEIVLNHSTAITKYNYDTLTVTSYQNSSGVTITSIATGATLRIIGDGFDPASAYTEVVFASMDALDLTSGLQVISSGGSNYLQLTVPSGVTTGAITVNSPKGTAVGPTLTITP